MEIRKILSNQLEVIRPSDEVSKKIDKVSGEFVDWLKGRLKDRKVRAEVFVGGSLAKGTLVKKDVYDVDVFVRFDKSYGDEKISKLLGRVLGSGAKKIHGSRDYYQFVKEGILIEVIPVLRIKGVGEAENVTDLSYLHVNYVVKKIRKATGLVDEIRLAKSFAHAQNCYGAESYIHGFSGYALELLMIHYGSFLKFVREVGGWDLKKKGKLVIDIEKLFKNRDMVLLEMNESKRQSPIVLVDPTNKDRNTLSSLNKETFFRFQNSCKGFLRSPGEDWFVREGVDVEFKKFKDVKKMVVETSRQAGDIAGTKSKKFFDFVVYRLKKEFEIKKQGFDYNEEENKAYFYFVLSGKKDEIVRGPPVTAVENLKKFKKVHPPAFIKNHYACVKLKHSLSFEEWFAGFVKGDKKIIKEMGVEKIGEG